MGAELQFLLKGDTDPEDALARLQAADTDQAFTFGTSEGQLCVASQIDHTMDELNAFVRQTVGALIEN